jgi:hypothetical protein
MLEYLDNATATEVEFVLWGLSIIGLFCIVAGVTLFARYCWRLWTPTEVEPVVSDARWRPERDAKWKH